MRPAVELSLCFRVVEKNKIKPTEVSIGSHKKVIWRCEKGHEWEAAVRAGQ